MNTDEWRVKLTKLGLSMYEARVYLCLLQTGTAAAAKIVSLSDVPQPRVYAALKALVERGYAELQLGQQRQYRAIQPNLVFERHYQRQQDAFRKAMEETAAEMEQLQTAIPKQPIEDPISYGIRLVRGKAQIRSALQELNQNATREICLFGRYPAVVQLGSQAMEDLLARGVRLRMILERPFLEDPATAAHYQKYALKKTGNLRWRESLPVRLTVFDGRTYVLPLQETGESPTLLVIPNETAASGMQRLFEEIWQSARAASEVPVPQVVSTN
jgi:sugar-specific transcriptional regulator TrmB